MLFYKGDVLKLAPRIREVDRQYEYNNNCELDNGVYNKFMVENMNKKVDHLNNTLASKQEEGAFEISKNLNLPQDED